VHAGQRARLGHLPDHDERPRAGVVPVGAYRRGSHGPRRSALVRWPPRSASQEQQSRPALLLHARTRPFKHPDPPRRKSGTFVPGQAAGCHTPGRAGPLSPLMFILCSCVKLRRWRCTSRTGGVSSGAVPPGGPAERRGPGEPGRDPLAPPGRGPRRDRGCRGSPGGGGHGLFHGPEDIRRAGDHPT